MAVTIRDVARGAGVSVKTVSRVLNAEPVVSDETRATVLAAMQRLGYVPNISAQRLARGRSHTLGLIFSNATWGYVTHVLRGMLRATGQVGYEILIRPCDITNPVDRDGIVNLVAQQEVDGLLFTPPCDNDGSLLRELLARRVPFVRLTPGDRQLPLAYVTADDFDGAYRVTEHLLSLGHRRIGFVRGHPAHRASHDRAEGFRAALAACGAPFDPALVRQGDWQFDSGLAAGHSLLAMDPRPTAIFASDDEMAAGVLCSAYQRGIPVPELLSIAGFDNEAIATQVWPLLTTIQQPIQDIAALATRLLLAMLKGEVPSALHHVLPVELIVRGSTGPAAAQGRPSSQRKE